MMISYENGRLSIHRRISASNQQVWDILVDTAMWSVWGPSVVAVDCPQQYIMAGCRGRVKTVAGFWVPFAIISFDEPHHWSWRIGTVRATGHSTIRLDDNSCRLSFDMPWWAIFYLPVCYVALRRIEKLCLA